MGPRIAQSVAWGLVLNGGPPCLAVEIEKARTSAHPPAFVLSRNRLMIVDLSFDGAREKRGERKESYVFSCTASFYPSSDSNEEVK
jgi:hypothetical protein